MMSIVINTAASLFLEVSRQKHRMLVKAAVTIIALPLLTMNTTG
jgi:hypothetical protein